MKIIKGNTYEGKSGVVVKATEIPDNSWSFTGIVTKNSDCDSYTIGLESDGWITDCFELHKTELQIEKERVKSDLIKSIKLIFSNEDNVCENLNEIRDYITNLMSSDY